MEPDIKVYPYRQLLDERPEGYLAPVLDTESFTVEAQRLDGPRHFKHVNDLHDEVIILLSGELEIHVENRVYTVRAGEIAVIPKGVPHGGIAGKDAELLLLEGIED